MLIRKWLRIKKETGWREGDSNEERSNNEIKRGEKLIKKNGGRSGGRIGEVEVKDAGIKKLKKKRRRKRKKEEEANEWIRKKIKRIQWKEEREEWKRGRMFKTDTKSELKK